MKRQENSIFSNKKRGLKYALCTITLLCCLLSTIAHAEYRQEFNDKVASFRLWGRTTIEGIKSWREITITETETGVYETAYQVYEQDRQRAVFAFPKQIVVDNIYLEYTLALDEKIYGNGNIIFSEYDEQIAYTLQDYGPNAQTAWFPTGSIAYEKSIKGNEITYKFKYNGDKILMRSVRAFTSIKTVSTNYTIKNIILVINDKDMQITANWEDKQQELENAIKEIEVTVDKNAIDNIINNPPTIDSTINVGIFNFTNETIPLYIMSLTLSLAIISFLLYGKK